MPKMHCLEKRKGHLLICPLFRTHCFGYASSSLPPPSRPRAPSLLPPDLELPPPSAAWRWRRPWRHGGPRTAVARQRPAHGGGPVEARLKLGRLELSRFELGGSAGTTGTAPSLASEPGWPRRSSSAARGGSGPPSLPPLSRRPPCL